MSIRTEKVASAVRQALARPLADVSSEVQAGFITVTHVRMSPDLRIARVYLSIFGGKIPPAQALVKVNERTRELRRDVTAQMRLRYSPELHFYLDDTLDAMQRIDDLLKKSPPASAMPPTADTEDEA